MTETRSAIVIGAGIGGLTAALALSARGWDVRLLERAPALTPVGFALIIAPNAQRALGVVSSEIVDEIHAHAALQGDGGIRNATGAWLSHNDPAIALERYGHPVVAIRRATLIGILASRLPAGALQLATSVSSVNPDAGEVTLEGGGTLRADVVVAADGVRSGTRATLFPSHPEPVFAGLTTWQAIIPGDRVTTHAGITWGRAGEFGVLRLSDGSAYAFSQAASAAPMVPRSADEERAEVQRRFGDLHAAASASVVRIEADHLLRADIYTLPEALPAFHLGMVAILGDAAHPMAPSLGQGACQAIEDAVTLAYSLDRTATVAEGLAEYSAARLPRTSIIVRRSAQIARVATATNPVFQALRNTLIRATGLFGPSAALRQADFVMRWDHPAMDSHPEVVR